MYIDIETLNKIRKEKRITYDELAKLTGYSRSTITNIFCGYVKYPRHETMQKIYEALGIDEDISAPAIALMQLRLNAGLTQEEMAQKLGVKISFYLSMERGILPISSEHLQIICTVFGVTLDYLLGKPIKEIEETTKEAMEKEIEFAVGFIDFILSDADTDQRHEFYANLKGEERELFVSYLLYTREDLQDLKEMFLSAHDCDLLTAYQARAYLWK